MLDQKLKEENFIDRKRQWKSGLDQRMGPSFMLTILPAVVMCVFLLMAAPYIRQIVAKYMTGDKKEVVQEARKLDITDAPAPAAPVAIPGNPEHADAEFYQKLYDEQGVNWRDGPVWEGPDESAIPEKEIVIEPLDVEIPASMMKTVDHATADSE